MSTTTPHYRAARRLAFLLTEHDRKQSTRKGHNPYAIGHYLKAVHAWEMDAESPEAPVKTLAKYFTTAPGDSEDFCLAPVRQLAREIQAGKFCLPTAKEKSEVD